MIELTIMVLIVLILLLAIYKKNKYAEEQIQRFREQRDITDKVFKKYECKKYTSEEIDEIIEEYIKELNKRSK